MARRRKKSKNTLIWVGLCAFGFVCFWLLSGCVAAPSPPPKDSHNWESRQDVANRITCHWSTKQVKEGACWCISNHYRGGFTLAPNKFCSEE
ncbi:MAG: hypothetical protein ACXAC5_04235 [Promethearchaeota archaeon]|jgi:hypothetical protein